MKRPVPGDAIHRQRDSAPALRLASAITRAVGLHVSRARQPLLIARGGYLMADELAGGTGCGRAEPGADGAAAGGLCEPTPPPNATPSHHAERPRYSPPQPAPPVRG